MAFGGYRKLLGCVGILAFSWLALPTTLWAQPGCAPCAATFGTPCAVGCQTHHCPPPFKYCYEGPPRVHWTRGCPRPICNPCDLPNWGYFETCWSPWPFPPNWAHCPVPPPAAFVTLDPYVGQRQTSQVPPVRTVQPGTVVQTPAVLPTPVFPMNPGEYLQTLPAPRPNGNALQRVP